MKLPDRTQIGTRIRVRGVSGSGKTTFARRLAKILNIPAFELDELYWEPDWGEPPDERFFPRVQAVVDQDAWVLEGNYTRTRPITDPRTQTHIWLDFPFRVTTYRVVTRTLRRGIKKEMLWGHSQEKLSNAFSRDSIILWSIKHHKACHLQAESMLADPPPDSLVLRFRHPKEAEEFLSSFEPGTP